MLRQKVRVVFQPLSLSINITLIVYHRFTKKSSIFANFFYFLPFTVFEAVISVLFYIICHKIHSIVRPTSLFCRGCRVVTRFHYFIICFIVPRNDLARQYSPYLFGVALHCPVRREHSRARHIQKSH